MSQCIAQTQVRKCVNCGCDIFQDDDGKVHHATFWHDTYCDCANPESRKEGY